MLVSNSEECSTGRRVFAGKSDKLLEDKILPSLRAVKSESEKFQELNDGNSRKKLDIPKTAFRWFPIIQYSKKAEFKAFLDELAGDKPLAQILQDAQDVKKKAQKIRIPGFPSKKGEVFLLLAEFNVPVSRAAWYLKLLAFYGQSVSTEQTSKGRSKRTAGADPAEEWTKKILLFLEDLWPKLTDANAPQDSF